MRAGELRRRVYLEAPTVVRDQYNAADPNATTWSVVACLWAGIKPISGRQLELAQASTITAVADTQITIRYRDDIRIGFHRIRYGPAPALCFETLTGDQFEEMTAEQFEGMSDEDESGETHLYEINDVQDENTRHRMLILHCTEVKA